MTEQVVEVPEALNYTPDALTNLKLIIPEPGEGGTRIFRPRICKGKAARKGVKNVKKSKSDLLPFVGEKFSPIPNGLPPSDYITQGAKLLEDLEAEIIIGDDVIGNDKVMCYFKELETKIRVFNKNCYQPVTL